MDLPLVNVEISNDKAVEVSEHGLFLVRGFIAA
jgi:hypothetical protein